MSVWCNLWACEEVRLIINLLHPTLIRQHKKVLAARCTLWTFFMVWLNSRLSTAQQVRFCCTIFSVLQLISSNALIWTRPDHFGGVGWNRFLAVLSIWFHMLWTTSILSRPVGLSRRERKRGRVETQSQRVPSYSFSFSSHLALSSWLATLIALPVPHFGCLACTWLALENSGFPDSNRCVLPTHPIQPDFTWQAGRILFNSNQVSGMDKLGHKICPKSSAVKISAFCTDFCNFLHFFCKFLLI